MKERLESMSELSWITWVSISKVQPVGATVNVRSITQGRREWGQLHLLFDEHLHGNVFINPATQAGSVPSGNCNRLSTIDYAGGHLI